jgi:hypothetical protein
MANQIVLDRLISIQRQLMAIHDGNAAMSASSRGTERETFIGGFLSKVLPPVFRFGSGDATDANGNRSGQLDVVIEYPFGPSLPAVGQDAIRLYLAETVAAVVEVKSDISGQWQEALATAQKLAKLSRRFRVTMSMGPPPTHAVPLFAVGYRGWKTIETLQEKLQENPEVRGILVLQHQLFVGGGVIARGPAALWAFICVLHESTNSLASASTDPLAYVE